MNKLFMAFGKGTESKEGNVVKKYIGVAPVYVLAVNPTKAELEKLYGEVKNKYDVLYKELNIERNRNLTIVISIVLVASLIFNILNFMLLAR